MCSACITISPAASKSAVEQSRRSLMLAECAARIRTAPISSQAARSAPTMTWRVIGSSPAIRCSLPSSCSPPEATIVPASSTSAPQPGGRTSVASGSSKIAGPRRRGRRAARRGGPVALPLAAEARLARDLGELPVGGRARPRLGPGGDHRQADVDQLDLALGVAVAVALLVRGGEALGELGRVGPRRAGHRQLEGLAAVAHLVLDLGSASSRSARRALVVSRRPRRRSAPRSARRR